MQERPSHERPSTYLRERGSFLSKGEKRLRGHAARAAADGRRPDAEPAGARALAREPGQPAHRARGGQPRLGAVLRPRPRRDQRGLRHAGRGAVAPRAARLARHRVRRAQVEPEGAPPPDRHLGDLPAVGRGHARRCSSAIRTTGCSRAGRGSAWKRRWCATWRSAAGGLLSPKIGGPSVFPPQPEGIWDNPYSDEKWVTSAGEDRYRRGLYTFIRRTSPYPSFMTFDATSRELCTVRRVRTNTPLQALTTAERRGVLRGGTRAGGSHDRARAATSTRPRDARRSGS